MDDDFHAGAKNLRARLAKETRRDMQMTDEQLLAMVGDAEFDAIPDHDGRLETAARLGRLVDKTFEDTLAKQL